MVRNRFIYSHLAEMRNIILNKSRNYDYLFSVDSDILLIDRNCLNKLLARDLDIVSSVIYNGYEFSPDKYNKFTNGLIKVGDTRLVPMVGNKNIGIKVNQSKYKHVKKRDIPELINLDLTGAVYLISNNVLKNKEIKYGFHIDGEDAFFCENAIKHKFKLYMDTGVYSQHIMTREWLQRFVDGEKID